MDIIVKKIQDNCAVPDQVLIVSLRQLWHSFGGCAPTEYDYLSSDLVTRSHVRASAHEPHLSW